MSDFYSLKYQDENAAMAGILDFISHIHYDSKRIEQQATVFIETIRARHNDVKGFNTLMQSYDLTSEEGLALMTLAEALLRVPDIATANALITDKLSDGDWSKLFEHNRHIVRIWPFPFAKNHGFNDWKNWHALYS